MDQKPPEEPEKKRLKPKKSATSKPDSFVMPFTSVVSHASFYSDSTKTYASDEERKRAEIQSMIKTWKHYYAALDAYKSIYTKTCDDLRGMRECNERIPEKYAEYQMFQLAAPYYMDALRCCIAIPITDRRQEDFEAITRIFSNLIVAITGMIQTLRVNDKSVQNFLDFYLKNFLSLNQGRSKFLALDGIALDKLLDYVGKPFSRRDGDPFRTTARLFLVIIRLFRTDTKYDEKLKEEIESLKTLSTDPDPGLETVKATFELFLSALKLDEALREKANIGRNVEFRVPDLPSSSRGFSRASGYK